MVQTAVSETLGQTVVVDNRAGASGSIAAEVAAQSAPDGYTFMVLSASLVIYGVVNKTRYDLLRDFDAVTQISASPYFFAIYPGLPATSVKELIAYAKANPGKLNFSSTGPASLAHLAGELFALNTGTQLVHVPYKGVGAAMPDMLAGRIQMTFLSGGSIMGQIRQGKLRGLAVASPTRVKGAPELPTMAEAGVPNFVVTQWHGIIAPRGTSRVVIERMHGEVSKAVQRPDFIARLAADGTDPLGTSPREFTAYLGNETAQWAKVVKSANIRVSQ
jgi:tripartite-type tricarboxylate transporter receptor subunit TctC